uniref:Cytidine monophosphate-N-acetylneuraminic acid hydroxylase n=1 Tax=Electrophorus electricus TaxID=8005 RepID=A0AAY5ETW6_ELEEL
MSHASHTVLELDATAVLGLTEGINFKKSPAGKCFMIYKDKNTVRACRNQCKHQGGKFIKDIEDIDGRTVHCTKHNWKLNVATMQYVNPPDSFLQEELKVVKSEDGGLKLVELVPPEPWTVDSRPAQQLQPGEVTLTYITHACMELKAGDKRMMFDPWLTGPAFARGCWLLHEPPPDAMDRLRQADLVYISHTHSDHLSYPSLKLLAQQRPDIPIYVGDTSRPVFWYLARSGVNLTNISVVPFGVWHNVDKNLRFMILMDGVHPEIDTCLIVDYKGHLILNTVDCRRPNNGCLPHGVDVMMSDFAGGASGFPMTFHKGKYTESWKRHFISRERKELLHYTANLVAKLQPKVYCPFASYFTEAHPSDRYIKNINTKNNPEDLNKKIKNLCPHITTWTPLPGSVLDLALALTNQDDCITQPPSGTKILKDSWDFDLYVDELNAAISSKIFEHKSWIQFYYNWAGFQNYNLVIRVTETDDDFQPRDDGYDYLVDFLDLSFPSVRPQREHFYVEIQNRIGVMRHVVVNGLLWDDLYIGFNNRISREPDIYHHKFWKHFQSELPLSAPDWDSFLKSWEKPNPTSTSTPTPTPTLPQPLPLPLTQPQP